MTSNNQNESQNKSAGARILLAYTSYPVTTAVYFERALRERHQVVTCGPRMDEGLIKQWNLEEMKLPVRDLDIPLPLAPDMGALLDRLDSTQYPDLYLWIESVHGYFPKNLSRVRCPKACYLIDTHLSLQWHLDWAKGFDHVFLAQREYVEQFHRAGMKSVHWLPLACDPQIHRGTSGMKNYDVGFVGSLNNERRMALMRKIEASMPVAYRRCFWTEMADFLSQCRIVFNNAVKNDLNMRLFETLSVGSFLLTDKTTRSGQDELFRSGEDLCVYDDEMIVEAARYYLEHPEERERIAARGQQVVHAAHTYAHRTEELLKVALGGQPHTPTAQEWRARSESQRVVLPESVPNVSIRRQTPPRSFVVPVLDMSPASPFNIGTLLQDMERVDGTMIVVFNSAEMAERWRSHPRVNRAVTMSHNVGVARAWNVGLHISETPVTFFFNADLHLGPQAVDALSQALVDTPQAGIVGPQGGFYHFESAKDLLYFDKGSFNAPMLVDDVSGFFFAVNGEMFAQHGLQFEDRFTPCYFEEWDIGLQCKRAGMGCYIIPVTDFEHEWSGSIRSVKEIHYFDRAESTGDILHRNRVAFWDKWKRIATESGNTTLFESYWVDYVLNTLSLPKVNPNDVQRIVHEVLRYFPGSARARQFVQSRGIAVPGLVTA
jgi:hypothetical protein